jgi:methionine--tRNA ligase beta chain
VALKTDPARAGTIYVVALNLARLLAAIAEPFMPGFSDKVYHQLNVDHAPIPDRFELDLPAGHVLNQPTPIFREILDDEVASLRARFAGSQTDQQQTAAASAASGTDSSSSAAAAAMAAAAATAAATVPDVCKLDLRVGRITRVWNHETADKMFCEEIDVGEVAPRRIASGLRQFYTADNLQDRLVLVLCNLPPRALVGFESQGMVLCATAADKSSIQFVDVPAGAKPAPRPDAVLTGRKSAWVTASPKLRVDAAGVAEFDGHRLLVNGEPFTSKLTGVQIA